MYTVTFKFENGDRETAYAATRSPFSNLKVTVYIIYLMLLFSDHPASLEIFTAPGGNHLLPGAVKISDLDLQIGICVQRIVLEYITRLNCFHQTKVIRVYDR